MGGGTYECNRRFRILCTAPRTDYDNELQRVLDSYVYELEASRAKYSALLHITPVRAPSPTSTARLRAIDLADLDCVATPL